MPSFRTPMYSRLRRRRGGSPTLFGLFVILGLGAAAYLSAAPSHDPPELVGRVRVVDGDTLALREDRIRLFGIDAPESRQLCGSGRNIPCGQRATRALAGKIGQQVVSCSPRDMDRYGRIVAVCFVGGEDLNAWMVREGQALAYRQYSHDYVSDERKAADARRGIWSAAFTPPWEWRQQD